MHLKHKSIAMIEVVHSQLVATRAYPNSPTKAIVKTTDQWVGIKSKLINHLGQGNLQLVIQSLSYFKNIILMVQQLAISKFITAKIEATASLATASMATASLAAAIASKSILITVAVTLAALTIVEDS